MKLSLSSCTFNRLLSDEFTRRDAILAFRECGFQCTDFDVGDALLDNWQENAVLNAQWLKEAGVTAPQGHAPCYNPFFMSPEERKKLENSIRFCEKAGIPALVVHPGAVDGNTEEEFFERNAEFYRSLLPIFEDCGVKLLVENIGNYADPYYLKNGQALRKLVDMLDHPLAYACWDVGHANHFSLEDCDQYTSILALGDKLAAVHVHNNCGYFDDCPNHIRIDMHTMPYASIFSTLNFDRVLKGLQDAGYKGTFNFEATVGNPSVLVEPFVLNGVTYDRVNKPSIRVWKAYNVALYEAGRFMLSQYGMLEE